MTHPPTSWTSSDRPDLKDDGQVVTITSDAEWDDRVGDVAGVCWLWAEQQPWIAFCTEAGDWYAVRPLTEDDRGTEAGAFGPVPLDTVEFPWQLASAEERLAVRDDVLTEKDAEIEQWRSARGECERQYQAKVAELLAEMTRDEAAEAEVARLREAVATVRKTLETVQNERNRAFLLLRVARRICTMPGPLLRAINGTTASESEGDIADDAAEVDAWLRDHALAPRESATEAPTCACPHTPENTWLSAASCGYGGGYEPGSMQEFNPDCPVHGHAATEAPRTRDGEQPAYPRKPRLRACVEAWPDCEGGEYDPRCCRFPKSCSCRLYDPEQVTPEALEDGSR